MVESQEKIYFEIPSDDLDEVEIETVWSTPHNGGFKLDNIPFYAKGVALNDIVSAKLINGRLYMGKLLEPSGHSTVRIWFAKNQEVQVVREKLRAMGCASELSDRPRLISVDIPPSVRYEKIKSFLDDGLVAKKWDYEEACLGFA